MRKTGRTVPVVALAAALAAGIGACEASAGPTAAGAARVATKPTAAASRNASGDPLTRLTAIEIARQAARNTAMAPVLRLNFTLKSGIPITYDLLIARGKGCVGKISYSKTLYYKIIYDGSTVWVQPSDDYYRNLGDSPDAVTARHGMYMKTTPGTGLGKLADECAVQSFINGYLSTTTQGSMYASAPMTLNGQRVIKLTDPSDGSYSYVTDTARPELFRLVVPSPTATIDFAYPATPPVITPPPASRIIDGT